MKNRHRQDLNIHGLFPDTTVNGPGRRCLIMLQGWCNRNCTGCFNPDTHSFKERNMLSPLELVKKTTVFQHIEGITISGGEPVLQIDPLTKFLKLVREKASYQWYCSAV